MTLRAASVHSNVVYSMSTSSVITYLAVSKYQNQQRLQGFQEVKPRKTA